MPPKVTVIPPRHNQDRKPPGSSRAANKMGKKQGLKSVKKPERPAKRSYGGAKLPPSANPAHRNTGGAWSAEVRGEANAIIDAHKPVDVKAVVEYVVSTGLERPIILRDGKKRPAYTEAIGLMICGVIACSATGVIRAVELLALEGFAITYQDVLEWKATNKSFEKLYEAARIKQAEYMQDLAAHVALHPLPGDVTKTVRKWSDGQYVTETTEIRSDNINRSRLIVDTIMRRSALLNQRWNDKRDMGEGGGPNEQLEALVAALAAPAGE
jgi:hypothetical protein